MEISEQLLKGLRESLVELKEQERKLLKASGLEESISKAQVEIDDLRKKEEEAKDEHGKAVKEKDRAVAQISSYFETAMEEIVKPIGKPTISVSENGSLFIGVNRDGKMIHGEALSGGEKVIFDAALAHAMTAGADWDQILVIEAAEADHDRIGHLISTFLSVAPSAQVIVNSWVGHQAVYGTDGHTDNDFSENDLLLVDLSEGAKNA